MTIHFDNSYARLPDRFYTRQAAIPVSDPALIRLNTPLADELGLDAKWLAAPQGVAMLAGNAFPDAAAPLSMAYAGHQFGAWVPQLGDGRALLIATVNAKTVAGYLAAFSQFVQPDVPIWEQMSTIVPTALTITALSYTGYTALGAGLGRAAMGAVLNLWVRRSLAVCFMVYGALLGASTLPPAR